MSQPTERNRLDGEASPYLQQHADNPVNWQPWGDEAFERAREHDVPVFVSIGYSSCHWCHVMAEESFEDESVAALLNEEFVSVKVDREERPDVDSTFMTVCQLVTGGGGWPLSRRSSALASTTCPCSSPSATPRVTGVTSWPRRASRTSRSRA